MEHIDKFDVIRRCACCKKSFSMYQYNIRDYVYKERKRGTTYWYCCYACYRKGVKNERNSLYSVGRGSEECSSI